MFVHLFEGWVKDVRGGGSQAQICKPIVCCCASILSSNKVLVGTYLQCQDFYLISGQGLTTRLYSPVKVPLRNLQQLLQCFVR